MLGLDLVARLDAEPVEDRLVVVGDLLRCAVSGGEIAQHLEPEMPGLVQERRQVSAVEQRDAELAVAAELDIAALGLPERCPDEALTLLRPGRNFRSARVHDVEHARVDAVEESGQVLDGSIAHVAVVDDDRRASIRHRQRPIERIHPAVPAQFASRLGIDRHEGDRLVLRGQERDAGLAARQVTRHVLCLVRPADLRAEAPLGRIDALDDRNGLGL